jgi:hypothetical protein
VRRSDGAGVAVVLVDDRDEAIARYIAAASPSVVLALLDRVERAERLHSQAEAQIECRNELRFRAIRAEEDHRAAVDALETYESRIRDIADHVLGIQPPDVATVVLLDAIEREAGRRRIAQLQAEAAFAACAEAVGVMRETDGRASEPLGVDVGEEPEAPHRWDSDNDGHDWQPVDGELHLNFEAKRHWEPTMDLVIIDPDKFEELRKEMGAQWERMGGDLPTISEGGLTYARSWVKGKFCVIAEKKQGLCPHCGGVLEVSPWP